MSATSIAPQTRALLASDRVSMPVRIDAVPILDRARRGAVANRPRPGVVRRVEPGPFGPLVLDAVQRGAIVELGVWGAVATPADVVARAMADARSWIGYDDPPVDLAVVVADRPDLRAAARRCGPVVLSRLPRVGEAVGRAILGQLVQGVEAKRSTAQMAAALGHDAGGDLWCWPTADVVGQTPGSALRLCGISLRATRALHAAALHDRALEGVRDDAERFDRRVRALPGIGVWTSAEARLALGDADAVAVGDYHLPTVVCHALAGAGRDECSDELMLELLAPYAGQRGRVIRLVERAARRGLLPRLGRRGPRAALSAHRYW